MHLKIKAYLIARIVCQTSKALGGFSNDVDGDGDGNGERRKSNRFSLIAKQHFFALTARLQREISLGDVNTGRRIFLSLIYAWVTLSLRIHFKGNSPTYE